MLTNFLTWKILTDTDAFKPLIRIQTFRHSPVPLGRYSKRSE
ncbi:MULTISPECIES: hypothetical protein [unclassified Schlesneria]